MKIKNVTKVAAPLWLAVAMTAACSDDGKDSDGEMPSSTATNTNTAPTTNPSGTGPGTTPVGPGTTPGGTNTAGPNPTPSGSGTTAPISTAPMSACMNTAADGTMPADVNGATWIFSYSDITAEACMMPTTHCLDHTSNSICFDGTAAEAGENYECWGSGYGIQMAAADEMGNVTLAWDATAVGVAGVKFTLAGMAGGPKIRAQISQDGLPDTAAFVHGGGTADIGTDGEKILMFEDFALPSWTTMANPELADTVLDPTQIKALQIQVVTVQTGAKVYNFCLSGLTWITADMTPVDVIPPEPPEEGDAGPTPVGDGGVEPGDAGTSDGGVVPTPGDGGLDAAVEEDGGAGGATEAGVVEDDAGPSAGGMGAGGAGGN